MTQIKEDLIKKIRKIKTREWLGFEVESTGQTITLVIENLQLCCEEWGADCNDMHKFIGAQISKVKWGKDRVKRYADDNERRTAVVDVLTNSGRLELSVWNDHNGYYEHSVKASWRGYEDTQLI